MNVRAGGERLLASHRRTVQLRRGVEHVRAAGGEARRLVNDVDLPAQARPQTDAAARGEPMEVQTIAPAVSAS